jgi:hypothetical protein
MFASLIAWAERLVQARAAARHRALADRLAETLPRGVRAEATGDGVLLSGRRLRRRLAKDPALRQAVAERGR